MFCPKCGSENAEGAAFCHTCGNQLKPVRARQPMEKKETAKKPAHSPAVRIPVLGLRDKVMVAEVILLFALLAAFFVLGSTRFGTEGTADRFARAYLNGDWNTVYDYLDLEGAGFLDRENFNRVMSSRNVGKLSNYEITVGDSASKLSSFINLTYQMAGEIGSNQETFRMNKRKQKQFLFFDVWKVSPEAFLHEDCQICVPAGATVKLNDTALGEKERDLDESDAGYDSYRLPALFDGNYDIQVSLEPMEPLEGSVQSQSGLMFLAETMVLSGQEQEKLVKSAASMLKQTYESALTNAGFEKLKEQFGPEGDVRNAAEQNYTLLADAMYSKDKAGIDQIDFSGIKGNVSVHIGEEGINAYVTLDYLYDVSYTYSSWWGDDYEQGNYSSSRASEYQYEYKDGSWKLISADFDKIYYY